MNLYKQCIIGLAMVGMVGFAGCKDDKDPSIENQFENVMDNYTDLLFGLDFNIIGHGNMIDPVYGKVKSIEVISYNNSTWDAAANKVKEGAPSYKTFSQFNEAGFLTSSKYFNNVSASNELRVSSSAEYTLDNRNRRIKEATETFSYSTDETTSYITHEVHTTYDDANKTATVLYYSRANKDADLILTTKTVYPLLENGRIDQSSYTQYQKSAEADDMDKINYSKKIVDEKDSHGNWIVTYTYEENHYNETPQVSVYGYIKRTIVYY